MDGANLFRRIEVAFPVQDPVLKQRVVDEGLKVFLTDNRDAWDLASDGTWTKRRPKGREKPLAAQAELLQMLRQRDRAD